MAEPLSRHDAEIQRNAAHWARKPILRRAYAEFYRRIAAAIRSDLPGLTVELGSGIGNIKEAIPGCLRTDIFPNPWLDQVENAYGLSFTDGTVANLILFDVFHHLRYPGSALRELHRVLRPGGRVVIFEPCVSLFGLLVFGLLHPEPLALSAPIEWLAPAGWSPAGDTYYAAQGNASRIFRGKAWRGHWEADWSCVQCLRLAALPYILSGGYSRPQVIPSALYPLARLADAAMNTIPALFATRLLVVLEKRSRS